MDESWGWASVKIAVFFLFPKILDPERSQKAFSSTVMFIYT